MTKEEYQAKTVKCCTALGELISETISLTKAVVGNSLTKLDLYLCPLLNRSIYLTRGFSAMIRSRNLTRAGAILRLQLDNCVRLYAVSVAEDQDAVIDCVISGGKLIRLKDKNGHIMTDGYLKNCLAQYDKQFPIVYDYASGFIHFSNLAFQQSVSSMDNGESGMSVAIGREPSEKTNEALCEIMNAFIHYTKFFNSIMEGAALSKTELEKYLRENTVHEAEET